MSRCGLQMRERAELESKKEDYKETLKNNMDMLFLEVLSNQQKTMRDIFKITKEQNTILKNLEEKVLRLEAITDSIVQSFAAQYMKGTENE